MYCHHPQADVDDATAVDADATAADADVDAVVDGDAVAPSSIVWARLVYIHSKAKAYSRSHHRVLLQLETGHIDKYLPFASNFFNTCPPFCGYFGACPPPTNTPAL